MPECKVVAAILQPEENAKLRQPSRPGRIGVSGIFSFFFHPLVSVSFVSQVRLILE